MNVLYEMEIKPRNVPRQTSWFWLLVTTSGVLGGISKVCLPNLDVAVIYFEVI